MKVQKFMLSAAALLILIACSAVFAQDAPAPGLETVDKPAAPSSRASYFPLQEGAKKHPSLDGESVQSTTPYRTFSSGAGLGLFKWTISSHGNIIDLESPAGFSHLDDAEGYVVSMNTSIGVIRYYDAGFVEASGCSGNIRSWSSNVFESGVNPNGTTLTRSTCDGAWQLAQTFTMNAINQELTVTMTLKNTSGFNYTGVQLSRYFDGNIDNDYSDDVFSRTFDSVEGRDSTIDLLSLTAISFNIAHTTAIHTFTGWDTSLATQASLASPTATGDYVGRVTYSLGTINNNTQKIVKVLYKRS
jgi:hypothetical protein